MPEEGTISGTLQSFLLSANVKVLTAHRIMGNVVSGKDMALLVLSQIIRSGQCKYRRC